MKVKSKKPKKQKVRKRISHWLLTLRFDPTQRLPANFPFSKVTF